MNASHEGLESHIVFITERPERIKPLVSLLRSTCNVRLVPPAADPFLINSAALCIVLDVDLLSARTVHEIEPIRQKIHTRSLPSVLVIEKDADERDLSEIIRRAKKFGVRNYIYHPFDADEIYRLLTTVDHKSNQFEAGSEHKTVSLGVSTAYKGLSRILDFPRTHASPPFRALEANTSFILDALNIFGINPWMKTVRRHHHGTYRHSLLVTGFAVAFSQKLKMSASDQQRIAHAALLHDVGKSFIPLDILNKPGKLTELEMEEIRRHPRYGHDLLTQQGDFPEEILEAVLHHHEFLDGSGYPDGFYAEQITDIVRIVTIADIFSALVEERSYRRPLSPIEAFDIMRDMNRKLDVDLVGAFRVVVDDIIK